MRLVTYWGRKELSGRKGDENVTPLRIPFCIVWAFRAIFMFTYSKIKCQQDREGKKILRWNTNRSK